MKIKKLKFIVIISLIPFITFSQTKKIVLKIDTVYSKYNFDNFKIGYSSFLKNKLVEYVKNPIINPIDENKINYITEVLINNDSSRIEISIDSKEGNIRIYNFESFENNDTIRIDYLELFESDLIDTSYTFISYFRDYGDSIALSPKRVKKSFETEKKRTTNNPVPNIIVLKINDQSYFVKMNKERLPRETQLLSGEKPKRYADKRKGERKWVMSGIVDKTNWNYVGEVKLQ